MISVMLELKLIQLIPDIWATNDTGYTYDISDSCITNCFGDTYDIWDIKHYKCSSHSYDVSICSICATAVADIICDIHIMDVSAIICIITDDF